MKDSVQVSKADLHVHSKFSDRPSEWFLRRIGAPESYVEPLQIYRSCKAAGMDYVTISDHNCICGALEIAHLPGVFLSSELTTYFPENGCKIHCLVSGITERSFAEMQALRENIYDLHAYLNEHQIIHTIAHPLYRVNDRLTPELFEKLLLLFNRFEGINGSRDPRACEVANLIFKNLTPELISELANRHHLEPTGLEPWNKTLTGGSDDHSGLYPAGAYTVTPQSSTVFGFLEYLRDGRHEPGGRGGTSIRLANSLYKIAYSYYRDRLLPGGVNDRTVLGAMLRKLSAEEPLRQQPAPGGLRHAVKSRIKKTVHKYKKRQLTEIERLIVDEFSRVIEEDRTRPQEHSQDDPQGNFYAACQISQQLSYRFFTKFLDKLRKGEIIGSLQAVSSLGPVLLGMAPYLTAFKTQHKDDSFLRTLTDRFPAAAPLRLKTGKKAWATDTFGEVNGVAHTINTLAGMAYRSRKKITVLTCMESAPETTYPLKNFTPVGSFQLPEYESIQTVFPPFMEMLAWLEREQFDEVLISTPGPVGLCALTAARMLGLPVKAIYHTDFPRFVLDITEDVTLEETAWKYMRWFYGQAETVFTPTRQYRQMLIDGGFEPERIDVLPRGVNLKDFNPARRQSDHWDAYGLNGCFKFIYVGRVSKEKNIDTMLRGFLHYREQGGNADLVVVGDGPYAEELKSRYAEEEHLVFTGVLRGARLAEAYASADAFIFPSMTDTFGNAVLEAHASGLPAIVSDQGGPQEIVRSHQSGLVIDARTPDAFAEAMHRMQQDRDLYHRMKFQALEKAKASRWQIALELL
jgi:glycosyltransferase involved in cell wall biosynthesis